jgi:HEPN domain-containing protein
MTPKKIATRNVPRDEYHSRLKNALDRRAAMERELAARAYDPALVLAVQAAIAGSDAVTIFHLGERSAADRHLDALSVFSRVSGVDGLEEARKHLSRLISEKFAIEYSGDAPKPREVESLIEHARRFLGWVEKHLPEEKR